MHILLPGSKKFSSTLKYNHPTIVCLLQMNAEMTINETMANSQKRNITETINAYSKRLMGFIRKRVTNEADAEDILQDVFYQLVGNTEPIEQLTGWLFRVTRNKIIDKQRKMKPALLDDIFGEKDDEDFSGWAEMFFDADENPETEYLRAMFWEELNAALDELPANQKEVFVLNEMEGVSFKEISELTGDPVNTLISRKRYAVLHLRERLSLLRDELLNY
jgi:RNA polymerase sigma factor (sigma-70 family)